MAEARFDNENNNILHEILMNADCEEEIEAVLQQYLSEISTNEIAPLLNEQNIYGNTPLLEYLSTMDPSWETVKQITQLGCDVNIADNLQITPLYKITAKQFVPSRLLEGMYLGDFEKGIVEQQNDNERQIMKTLISAGSDVNKPDIFGRPPLFLANDIEVIRMLIENGASLNISDRCGRSLLHSSLSMPNHNYLFKFYISKMKPTLLQKPDIFGSTPLHYAAILRQKDIFDEIIKNGATLGIKDNEGNTPESILQLRLPSKTVTMLHEKHMRKKVLKKVDIVHFTDIYKSGDLSNVVNQPGTIEDIYEILNLPGLGGSWDEKESEQIKQTIVKLAENLCDSMGTLDRRFRCTLFRTGSSAEGTKIGDPTEFDFVFCLQNFSELCEMLEVPNKKGFAELKAVNTFSEKYHTFFDSNKKLNATEVRLVFSKLLKRIVLDKNTWDIPNIFFDGDVMHLQEYDRPVFTLKLKWFGQMYKDEEISLDIVPAVRQFGWWPSDTDFTKLDMVTEQIRREGCLLLLQSPYFQDDTLMRISCSPAEICLMQSLPVYIRESYRLCKLLRHKSVCPQMDPDSTSDYFPLFEAEDSITSYMLKNCFFHILTDCKKEGLLRKDIDLSIEKQYTIDIAVKILRHFDDRIVSQSLPVYFIPNREDIFKFGFVELDRVDEKTVTKLNHFHCLRRRAFLKIMLHVLGKDLSNKTL